MSDKGPKDKLLSIQSKSSYQYCSPTVSKLTMDMMLGYFKIYVVRP
jgi:hypothetical protein